MYFSSNLSSKTNRIYPKNRQNNEYVCIYEIIRLILMEIKMKMKKSITKMQHK